MLILRVAQYTHIFGRLDKFMESEGVGVCNINSSTMSFLTSMRIATGCKHHYPDAVVVLRTKDAMAAISARKLADPQKSGNNPYSIIFYVDSSASIPRRITTEMMNNIDAWVFDCDETQAKWQAIEGLTMPVTAVIPRPGFHTPLERTHNDKPTIIYAGDMSNPSQLGAVLDYLAGKDLSQQVSVRVLGTGPARFVMPIVKRARANNVDVTWLGDNYDIDKELAGADAYIKSSPAPTINELILMSNSRPALTTANLTDWLDPDKRSAMETEASSLFESNYSTSVFSDRARTLLNKLRR